MDLYYGEYAGHDVDAVVTTRELLRMIRAAHIEPSTLVDQESDRPMQEGTGAGVIFGATGGVMEAALRTVYRVLEGEEAPADFYQLRPVRGLSNRKEAEVTIAGKKLRVCILYGTAAAEKFLAEDMNGYHFVEVMACPGGCVGGGGQPIHEGKEMAEIRSRNLYFLDSQNERRFSHENPEVLKTYEEYLEKPLSRMSHKLLHTDHHGWDMPLAPKLKKR